MSLAIEDLFQSNDATNEKSYSFSWNIGHVIWYDSHFTVKIKCDVSRDISFVRKSVKYDQIKMQLQIYPTNKLYFTFNFGNRLYHIVHMDHRSRTLLHKFIFSNTSFISNMGRIRFNEDFVRYADFGAQNVAIRSEYLYYIFLRIRWQVEQFEATMNKIQNWNTIKLISNNFSKSTNCFIFTAV